MTAAAFAGMGLGAIGNFIQGRQTSASERRALEAQREMRMGSLPLLLALGGGANASALGKTMLGRDERDYIFGTDPEATKEKQARVAAIQARMSELGGAAGRGFLGRGNAAGQSRAQQNRSVNDPEYQMLEAELQSLTNDIKNAQPGIVNAKELDAAAGLLPGAQYAKIAEQEKQAGLGQLGRYDTETENMMRMLKGFGDEEKARIERDSARDLMGANRRASLRMSRAGAGSSTLMSGALAQNAGQIGERRNNAITGINSGVLQQKLGMMGQRSGGRLGLETGLNQQNLNLQTAPLNQQMALLANIGQSGLGGNSYQPVGSVSPIGVGLQSAGNALSYWGGLNSLGGNGAASSVWANGSAPATSEWGFHGPDSDY